MIYLFRMSVIKPLSVFNFLAPGFCICWPRPVKLGFVGMASHKMADQCIWVHHVGADRTLDLCLAWLWALAGSKMTGLVCDKNLTFRASLTFKHVFVLNDVFDPTLASWTFLFAGGSSSNDLRIIGVNCFLFVSFLLFFLLVTRSMCLFCLKAFEM